MLADAQQSRYVRQPMDMHEPASITPACTEQVASDAPVRVPIPFSSLLRQAVELGKQRQIDRHNCRQHHQPQGRHCRGEECHPGVPGVRLLSKASLTFT